MMADKHLVLFQGDSITDGGRYREDPENRDLGHSYAYLIAAKLGVELADKRPRFVNRGISGDRVSDLYARWNEDVLYFKPTLLSILIGVNDAWRIMNGLPTGAADRFESAYRHLLEETKDKLPETALVLVEPFILNVGAPSQNWPAWQDKLAKYQSVVRGLAAEFGAVFVPVQQQLNEACVVADASYWLYDGVHPTAAGHQLIANQWLKAVQASPCAIR
ncbi:SGNH/GDSL hydrolase family protein [Paenibacillus thailandensis]|uniref:SGNH/GDSL hydrolase family protein n=1 Tax=Paenibacillus thailandensis TaxID=393250 RepID=A0ABW5QZA2_9BACL